MDEFSLIRRWFDWKPHQYGQVVVGIGDDAAVLALSPNLSYSASQPLTALQQVISTDTFILGVHCPLDTSPQAIGYKSLAVNLSDMAAMGAKPAWFTLAISLPNNDDQWLESFVSGMKPLADEYQVALIGGDTTRGALSITITIGGYVSCDAVLLRSTAKSGDCVYVTGALGVGGLGLYSWKNNLNDFPLARYQLDYPQPRINEGMLLTSFASSCIDLSDGLLADLGHLCERSMLGCQLAISQLPLSKELLSLERKDAYRFALTGGDDYELLYTVPKAKEKAMLVAMKKAHFDCYCIGIMDKNIHSIQLNGKELDTFMIDSFQGYNHFK